MLIDTHAHLNWDSYKEDFQEMLDRSVTAGVGIVINIGVNALSSKEVCALESPKLKMFASVGIHPEESAVLTTDEAIHQELGEIENIYREHEQKVVAIGECGLDYSHFEYGEHHTQKNFFAVQTLLAKQLNLPLIVHCRDAWEDIFIPELEGTTGVFHTFSGKMNDAQKALALGYYLSFSCTVTYPKNEELRQILKDIPLDRIVTETDCPFLPPQEIRGKRNEPMHVAEVIKVIAEVKGMTTQEVEQAVQENVIKLFRLG